MAHKPTVYYLLASVGIMVNLEPILTAPGLSSDAGGSWLNLLLLSFSSSVISCAISLCGGG